MEINEMSGIVIGSAIEVHRALGPGLMESVYQKCLAYELENKGLAVRQEVDMPVVYKGIVFDQGYRVDLLVNETIVIELKAVNTFNAVHLAQVLSYLKLGGYPLGLLINFNVTQLKQGVKRVINQ